jgi:beta-N-acetylhexosaminidase
VIVASASAGLIALEVALSEPIAVDPDAAPPVAETPDECVDESAMALRARLGQRLVVRMESQATAALRRQASRGEIGGVILFPPPGTDMDVLRTEVARLQKAAAEAGGPPLLVAIDQEGGEVKRLPEAPPDLAPPQISARGAGTARAQGLAAGAALARLGINVDLAPVLDVPATPESFIASRSFGSTPGEVAENGVAFATALAEQGVAPTAKHFPGLGRSAVNTDLEPGAVEASPGRLRADLVPFERAIDAGVPLVMLANAAYPPLDSPGPAFTAPAVTTGLLRDELGFAGVTITDDLDAGAVRAEYDRTSAAGAAVAGGSDLLLFAQTSRPDVLEGLVRDAERGRFEPAQLEEPCSRLLSLRESLAEGGA